MPYLLRYPFAAHSALMALLLTLLLAGCNRGPATVAVVPPLVLTPPPAEARVLLAELTASQLPPRDLLALARRLGGAGDIPAAALAEAAPPAPGAVASFWYSDQDSGQRKQIQAHLRYQSDSLNLWFEEGVRVDDETLAAAGRTLEEQVLPAVRRFFGPERRPGIDGDNRLHILHMPRLGGLATAYFIAGDGVTRMAYPYSNERELLYVSLDRARLGSEAYYSAVAHELQHLIQAGTDGNEMAWLEEGLAELASYVAGYPVPGEKREQDYSEQPDVQLTTFSHDEARIRAHYGAAYLFAVYFHDRFGPEATRALVEEPADGLAGVSAVLADQGQSLSGVDLFADWAVANYLVGIGRQYPPYVYETLRPPPPRLAADWRRFPVAGVEGVPQFGADYIRLQSAAPLTLVFTGTRQVALMDAPPRSGRRYWSTVPADRSDLSLTGRFDLSGLSQATLRFWTWYDIEAGFDYGYVAVSADDGASWTLLETEASTRANPQGNSYGPAYTGVSGGGESPIWIAQTADLSAFAGRPVWLRFEAVSDDRLQGQGWALDDIAIPELNFLDDGESDAGVWQAAGFFRHSNQLPQHFLLQLILLAGDGQVSVTRLALDEAGRGRWLIPLGPSQREAVLVVSGVTPVTTQPAAYRYRIAPAPPQAGSG